MEKTERSGKQCRERWVNHLQPDIRKEVWTTEEEELLVHAHSTFGNRWSAIAKVSFYFILLSTIYFAYFLPEFLIRLQKRRVQRLAPFNWMASLLYIQVLSIGVGLVGLKSFKNKNKIKIYSYKPQTVKSFGLFLNGL